MRPAKRVSHAHLPSFCRSLRRVIRLQRPRAANRFVHSTAEAGPVAARDAATARNGLYHASSRLDPSRERTTRREYHQSREDENQRGVPMRLQSIRQLNRNRRRLGWRRRQDRVPSARFLLPDDAAVRHDAVAIAKFKLDVPRPWTAPHASTRHGSSLRRARVVLARQRCVNRRDMNLDDSPAMVRITSGSAPKIETATAQADRG